MNRIRTKIATGVASLTLLGGAAIGLPATAGATPHTAVQPAASQAHQAAQTSVPVSGAVTNAAGQQQAFTGALSNLRVIRSGGALQLTGLLTGTGLPAAGVPFSAPLSLAGGQGAAVPAAAGGSCQVLQLDIGAIHLDLLGLVVDLAPVHLNITAVPGAGNLLGNLVCAVTGLLDRGGPLTGQLALLNQILSGLGLAA